MKIGRSSKRTLFVSVLLVTVISIGRSDLYRDISSNWRMVYEVYKRVMTCKETEKKSFFLLYDTHRKLKF